MPFARFSHVFIHSAEIREKYLKEINKLTNKHILLTIALCPNQIQLWRKEKKDLKETIE